MDLHWYNRGMKKITVGLFFGGVDNEQDVSRESAQTVSRHLDADHYQTMMIKITPTEQFMVDGVLVDPAELFPTLDIALLALHGAFGEDGTIQRLLDEYSVPYTGSDALASAVSFSKVLTKQVFDKFDIQTPTYLSIKKDQIATSKQLVAQTQEIFASIPQPCVIKPATTGSSIGVSVCNTVQEIQMGLENASTYADVLLAEEYITGCETTVGILEDFREESVYALPAVEIVSTNDRKIYDYKMKYGESSEEICPAVLEPAVRDELAEITKHIHTSLHLKDYSRTDFIIHPSRGIFALEVNALPALGEGRLFHQELEAIGVSMTEFLEHIITRNLV